MSTATIDKNNASTINITNTGGEKPWHIEIDNIGMIATSRAAINVPVRSFVTLDEAKEAALKIQDIIHIDEIKIDDEYVAEEISEEDKIAALTTSARDPRISYEVKTPRIEQQLYANKTPSDASAFDEAMHELAVARDIDGYLARHEDNDDLYASQKSHEDNDLRDADIQR